MKLIHSTWQEIDAYLAISDGILIPTGSIEQHGLFELRGDAAIMQPMDDLLEAFVAQHRMKLPGSVYSPCYKIIK